MRFVVALLLPKGPCHDLVARITTLGGLSTDAHFERVSAQECGALLAANADERTIVRCLLGIEINLAVGIVVAGTD